jgi:hypothetical protein
MANDKEQEQHEHIPTQPKNDDEQEKSQGTGGLLSMVGDPAGSSSYPHPPFFPLTTFSLHVEKGLLTPVQAKSSAPLSAPLARRSKKA